MQAPRLFANLALGRRLEVGVLGAALVMLATACGKTSIEAEPGVDAAPKPDSGALKCPQGLPGAKLILIHGGSGGAYCIDQREVTKGEYKTFLDGVDAKAPVQPPECAWNDRFMPILWDPYNPDDDTPPLVGGCPVQEWQLDAEPNRAVGCVDFCDAWAFCQAAGKRLCGEQGSNGAKVNLQADAAAVDKLRTSTQNEWYDACSSGGKFKFPYGDGYQPGACIDSTAVNSKGDAALDVTSGAGSACHGVGAGYDEVYNLSGDVSEWSNNCVDQGGVICVSAGGEWKAKEADLQCGGGGVASTRQTSAGLGFRCCADPTAAP